MTNIPTVRVGVDWDGDGFIALDAVPGDPVNIIPVPLTCRLGSITPIVGGSMTIRGGYSAINKHGIFELTLTTPATGDGIQLGDTTTAPYISVSNNTQYTLSWWWAKQATYTGGQFTVVVKDATGATLSTTAVNTSAISDSSLVANDDWTRFTATFTTGVSSNKIYICITSTGSSLFMRLGIMGVMVTSGAVAPDGFNTGQVSAYENITGDVMSFNVRSGYSNWTDPIMAEGTASITLDNTTRRYSPDNVDSPLYGNFSRRRLLDVAIESPETGAFETIWRGWATHYKPAPRGTGDQQSQISGEQGRFQLDTLKYSALLNGDYTVDEVLNSIFDTAGFISAASPTQFILNQSTFNKTAAFPYKSLAYLFETGISTINIQAAEDWGADTSVTRILQDLQDIEHGWLYFDRGGALNFLSRRHFQLSSDFPTDVSIDTDANDGDYIYGDKFYNRVKITYSPRATHTGTIWASKAATTLKPREKTTINAKMEYPEGKKLSVLSVDAFGAGSTFTATDSGGTDRSSGVTITTTLLNGEVTLNLENITQYTVSVMITLTGVIVESYGGQFLIVANEDDMGDGIYELTKSPKLVNSNDQADDVARLNLAMYDNASGLFNSVSLSSRDEDWLQRQLDLAIGTRVNLSEYQTAHSKQYVVIGEDFTFRPGILNSKHILFPYDERFDFKTLVGQSVLGVDARVGY